MPVHYDDAFFPGEGLSGLQIVIITNKKGILSIQGAAWGTLLGVWEWLRLLKDERSFVQKGKWGKSVANNEDPTSFSLGLTLTQMYLLSQMILQKLCVFQQFPRVCVCVGGGYGTLSGSDESSQIAGGLTLLSY